MTDPFLHRLVMQLLLTVSNVYASKVSAVEYFMRGTDLSGHATIKEAVLGSGKVGGYYYAIQVYLEHCPPSITIQQEWLDEAISYIGDNFDYTKRVEQQKRISYIIVNI